MKKCTRKSILTLCIVAYALLFGFICLLNIMNPLFSYMLFLISSLRLCEYTSRSCISFLLVRLSLSSYIFPNIINT